MILPRPKERESWRGWQPDKVFLPRQNPKPERGTFLLKGAGFHWERVEYDRQTILYEEGACKIIRSSIQDLLQEWNLPYGRSRNPRILLGIIKSLTNPNDPHSWEAIRADLTQKRHASPFFKQVFKELKKKKKV